MRELVPSTCLVRHEFAARGHNRESTAGARKRTRKHRAICPSFFEECDVEEQK